MTSTTDYPARQVPAEPIGTSFTPEEKRLILILGSPRSGTTWLASILDSYAGVLYCHEPLSRLARSGRQALLRRMKTDGSLEPEERRELFREFCLNDPEGWQPPFFQKDFLRASSWVRWLAWSWRRLPGLGGSFYRWLACPEEKGRYEVLIKEVDWALHAAALARALDPILIVVRRHPCGVVASLLRGYRLGRLAPPERGRWFDSHEKCLPPGCSRQAVLHMQLCEFLALQWVVQNAAYDDAIGNARLHCVVSYEKLCAEPVPTAQSVFEFLGWKVDVQTIRFLRHTIRREIVPLRTWLQGKRPYFGIIKDSRRSSASWKAELSDEDQQRILSTVEQYSDRYSS